VSDLTLVLQFAGLAAFAAAGLAVLAWALGRTRA
jgi:hypothetical protein